jgi:hypothetical protein
MNNFYNSYICEYCDKTFNTTLTLREHILYTHKNIIEFQKSKIYKKLLDRIDKLEKINNELIKEMKKFKEDMYS